jgi:hypothetical protein
MMITLSRGFKKPQDGDQGDSLFTALEENVQQLNDHDHDGVNSEQLTAQSIVGIPQNILAVNWVAFGPTGHYRQQVTIPAGFDFDTVQISFRLSTGEYVFQTVERVSDTQYFVYTIDNTLALIALYGG